MATRLSHRADDRTLLLPFGDPIAQKAVIPKTEPKSAPEQARNIAYERVRGKRSPRARRVMQALDECGPMTARQILREMIRRGQLPKNAERNAVSPRLTELADAGCIKALDGLRRVGNDAPATAWKITERGRLLLAHLERVAARSKT